MIPEPQRTYGLELLAALGSAADDFVVAGPQAMKFAVAKARGTKDVDFILDVIACEKNLFNWPKCSRVSAIHLSRNRATSSL
jgi:hypothetical protein